MSKQTKKITSIGGSALIEGIMMRGPKKSTVCVRTGKDEIYSEDVSITTIPENTHVEILRTETDEAGDLWYFVRYTVSPGMWHEGYCFAEYIETETEE